VLSTVLSDYRRDTAANAETYASAITGAHGSAMRKK
jgi:hypothetical protein